MLKRFILPAVVLGIILLVGTTGYLIIGGNQYTLLDAIYMTVITIATIGYSEIIDLTNNPGGRVFTMFIAFTGIGVLAYIMSSLTAFIVEGELTRAFRRRRMEKLAQQLTGHYIICGGGFVATNIMNELMSTKRLCVLIDNVVEKGARLGSKTVDVFIEGDATDDAVLQKCGVSTAAGLFAVTPDDNLNLVICLTARSLKNSLRIVSQCNDIKNTDKLKHAGANAVVSPGYIGGLRMASEMVRPTVVTFLDTMLRDSKAGLRVEEMAAPDTLVGKKIGELGLKRFREALLLAVTGKDGWTYNPDDEFRISPGNTLVFMTTVSERIELSKVFEMGANKGVAS